MIGLKWSTQMNTFTSKVIDASDVIHAIHGLMAHATIVSGHCAIDLNEILLPTLYNEFLKRNQQQ